MTSYDANHRLEDKNVVSKLHYFAVNEHTKYKPIPCELDDDDKYRVKNRGRFHYRLRGGSASPVSQ